MSWLLLSMCHQPLVINHSRDVPLPAYPDLIPFFTSLLRVRRARDFASGNEPKSIYLDLYCFNHITQSSILHLAILRRVPIIDHTDVTGRIDHSCHQITYLNTPL